MKEKLESLCNKYGLGTVTNIPTQVSGGLLHKMYCVETTKGRFAVKVLNPDIMKRNEALHNTICAEKIAEKICASFEQMQDDVLRNASIVVAKKMQDNHVLEMDGAYYMVFDWLEGKSVFAPDITKKHCEEIGRALGRIHAANIQIDGVEKEQTSRQAYNWDVLFYEAKKKNAECYEALKNVLTDLKHWDNGVISAWKELSQEQVITHRDLDPKNIMWVGTKPFLIDWEAAGYVNPHQELVEVINYWITDVNGAYDEAKFQALVNAYQENVRLKNVNWEAVLMSSFDGMLGWLEYSIKRAVGMEGSTDQDKIEGANQTVGTIAELIKYEEQMKLLMRWLKQI